VAAVAALGALIACGDDAAGPGEPPAFAPTAPALLSTGSPTKDEDPSVIRARDGSMVVAWFSDRGGTAGDIYITRATDGSGWAPAVRVTTSVDGDFYPQLFQDATGTFHLVWFRWYALGRGHILHNTSTSALAWDPADEDTVTTDPGVDDWVPSVTGAGDSLVVFFVSRERDAIDTTATVYMTSRGPAQPDWTAPLPVPGANSPTEHDHLPFAAWTGGEYTLVWVRHDTSQPAPWLNPPPDSHLYVATSATGASWSAAAPVTNEAAPIIHVFPALYPRSSGAWSLVWLSTRAGAPAVFELPLANLGVYPTGIVENTLLPPGYSHRVAATSTPTVSLGAWVQGPEGAQDIYYRFFAD
jgi:hypothetical protein